MLSISRIKYQKFIKIDKLKFDLGFTFSFPCKQEGLASARLTAWTKGFSCSGVVNNDVVKLLQEAMNEKVILNIFNS